MEVDNAHFRQKLQTILGAIAAAKFVTIDIEMSGITTRQRYGTNDRSHNLGKPSLQQQYEDSKEAAERYQVLQIGITTAEEDQERGRCYLNILLLDWSMTNLAFGKGIIVARPFNFYLNPTFLEGERLQLTRDIVFSSNSIHFLLQTGFDMGAVFTKGIHYLSHHEEATARKNYLEKQDRIDAIPDLVIDLEDKETLSFYDKSRQGLLSYISEKKVFQCSLIHIHLLTWYQKEFDFFNIGTPGGLNRYQVRLIYQLVRKEFPGYRAFQRNRGQFMQIEKINDQKEAEVGFSEIF